MIQNLKDLEKLLKLLRKQGVTAFKMGDIDLTLGEPHRETQEETQEIPAADELTDEELIAWSLGEAARQ